MLIRTLFKVLTLPLALFSLSASIYAHPHNWIDLNTTFTLDDKVRLVQIKQSWEFDRYYSMMTHADLLNEFSNEKKGLIETARRMINSLKNYDYFSTLSLEGSKIDLGIPEKYLLYTKKKEGQSILVLEMTFEIEANVKIENKKLSLKVFDPTYYIAMNHTKDSNIEIVSKGPTECSKQLEIPQPSDDLLDYAQSLDKTQKNTNGLGESFAETIIIHCI